MRTATLLFVVSSIAFSQTEIRPVPAPGVEVPAADRKELEAGLARLKARIGRLQASLDESRQALIPDVSIFHEAVRYALHYNATEYAANFFNIPTVAYSGEKDRQKQAADIMAKALAGEGMKLTHIIGPDTEHRYHPDAIVEINRRMDAIAARGREAAPRRVRFTTFTLRYNRMKWVAVDAMDRHWERASVDAQVSRHGVEIKTSGVAAFRLNRGQTPHFVTCWFPYGSIIWRLTPV